MIKMCFITVYSVISLHAGCIFMFAVSVLSWAWSYSDLAFQVWNPNLRVYECVHVVNLIPDGNSSHLMIFCRLEIPSLLDLRRSKPSYMAMTSAAKGKRKLNW